MPLDQITSPAEMLLGSLTETMGWDASGNLSLLADNLWPNQYLTDEADDGVPTGHEFSGMPERIVGYHVNVSMPGSPRRSTMRRQTSAMLPADNPGWKSEAPWVPGPRITGSNRKPPPPDVDVVPSSVKGFGGGPYAWAYGFSDSRRNPTTITGWRHFELATGEVPAFPVPESFPKGAKFWDLYLTRKGPSGGVADTRTGSLLVRVEISTLRPGGTYTYRGSPERRGKVPNKNESGIPVRAKRRHPGHFREVPSQFGLAEGIWRLSVQIANGRGGGLLSPVSAPYVVRGDTERRLVSEALVSEVLVSEALVSDSPEPSELHEPHELHQAEGKREDSPFVLGGNTYAGEEVDFEESRLVALMNASRRERGLADLVIDRELNRDAYRAVGGSARPADYPYPASSEQVRTSRDSASDAILALEDYDLANWSAVGVAREPARDSSGFEWCVVYGASPDSRTDGASENVCEFVEPDGTTHSYVSSSGEYIGSRNPLGEQFEDEVQFTDVMNSWHLVSVFEDDSARMLYTYSGSYGQSLGNAASRWNALGKVRVEPAGSFPVDVRITDGALPSGVYGRTYSDGRMIGNSEVLARATGNANQAMWTHELGHALGFDHAYGVASVMNTPISSNSTSNYASPTSYDRSEYTKRWGYLQNHSSGGTAGTGGTTGGTGGTQEDTGPKYETIELGYKKKTAMLLLTPKFLRKRPELRYTWWLFHTPLEGGDGTWYRFAPAMRTRGSEYFAPRGNTRRGITVSGPIESGPNSVWTRAVSEEPPQEDGSVIEAPDPTSVPDAPERAGLRVLDPGTYLVSVQGVLEDGTLTKESEPVERTTGPNQMLRVSPVSTVNVLKNAEFARLDGRGHPEDWTSVNVLTVSTNSFSVADGELTVEAAESTASAPRFDSTVHPVSSETVLTAAGNIGADLTALGSVAVVLRQLDESGAFVSDLVCGEIPEGQVGDISFRRLITGAGRHESCAFVHLSCRLRGANVRGRGRFRDLKLLPFDADVRKFDSEGFDPPSETPVSGGSFVAFGEPASPEGLAAADPEVPLALETFESGAWSAGWTHAGSVSAHAVEAAAAIHGTRGWRVSDGGNSLVQSYFQRSFTGLLDGGAVAMRLLLRVAQRPTRGVIKIAEIRSQAVNLAWLTLNASGTLSLLTYSPPKKRTSSVPIATLYAGAAYDIEVLVSASGTREARVSVGFISYGSRRQIVYAGTRDFFGAEASVVRVGVESQSDRLSKWQLHYDGVVVTRHGDVPAREKPASPPSYTPPPLDRPTKNSAPRQFAESEGDPDQVIPIRQAYLFLAPGEAPPEDPAVIQLLDEPFAVKPGVSYTLATFLRYSVFTPEAAPGIRVWLEGEPGSGLPPLLAASLGEMSGRRGWHPTSRPEEDDFLTFTVPEISESGVASAYTRARVEGVFHDGVYLMQEPLHAQGSYATFAEREQMRGWGMATSGEASFVLDVKPPAYELAVPRTLVHVSERGVKVENSADLPAGVSASALYSQSSDLLGYSGETPDPDEYGPGGTDGTPGRYLRTRIVFTGDGRNSAKVPSGGIYARTWHPDAVLLREDGTHFPGIAFVSKVLFPTSYPDVDADSVGGHFLGVRESDDIGRIREIEISVMTEAAAREIEHVCLAEELRLEVPTAGGNYAGEAFLVRFREQVEFTPEDMPPRIAPSGDSEGVNHRRILFRASVAEAEIIESARMLDPNMRPVPVVSLASGPRAA